MRELDQLLGAWLDQAWPNATRAEQLAFDRLLGCEDDQIWDWLMGRAEPPCAELHALIECIGGHYQAQKQKQKQQQDKAPPE